jgi:hypothetical protein
MEKLRELIVSGSVLDAQTSEPVPRFTVRLAEIQNPDFAPESTFIGTAGRNGTFAMPVTTPNNFQRYLVEISAEGYLPQVSSALSLSSGGQQLKFLLKKGRNLEGEIVAADGSTPVSGAHVFLCNATAGVYMDKPAEARDISGDLPEVTTGANGRFHFEPRADAHTIVVVHPSGYLEIPAAEFQKTNRFRLQPYGIIEGTLQVNGKPAAGESVGVSTFIYPWGDGIRNFPPLQLYLTATTDADGRFRFEKVPPGEREIHHTLKRRAGRIGPIPNSNRTFVQVEPGKISRVELGKSGQQVIGKIELEGRDQPIDWQQDVQRITTSFVGHEPPRKQDFPTLEAFMSAARSFYQEQKQFWQSPEGRQLERTKREYAAAFDENGSFAIHDVLPGRYTFAIRLTEIGAGKFAAAANDPASRKSIALTNFVFTVPEGHLAAPYDLGTIHLAASGGSKRTRQ